MTYRTCVLRSLMALLVVWLAFTLAAVERLRTSARLLHEENQTLRHQEEPALWLAPSCNDPQESPRPVFTPTWRYAL